MYKYWIVRLIRDKDILIVRQIFIPTFTDYGGLILLDGPITDREEAVKLLNFWRTQYE